MSSAYQWVVFRIKQEHGTLDEIVQVFVKFGCPKTIGIRVASELVAATTRPTRMLRGISIPDLRRDLEPLGVTIGER